MGLLIGERIAVFSELSKESEEYFGVKLVSVDQTRNKYTMIRANLKRIRIPGDPWPGLDYILACLENVLALDDNFECRLHVFMSRHLSNNAMKMKIRNNETPRSGLHTRNCNPSKDRYSRSAGSEYSPQ